MRTTKLDSVDLPFLPVCQTRVGEGRGDDGGGAGGSGGGVGGCDGGGDSDSDDSNRAFKISRTFHLRSYVHKF